MKDRMIDRMVLFDPYLLKIIEERNQSDEKL
jgi:hypothetical protein